MFPSATRAPGSLGSSGHSAPSQPSWFPEPDEPLKHAELKVGNGLVMIDDAARTDSPFALPGPVVLYVVVDDPDGLHDRAVAGGADIVMGLTDQDYGSREFAARDPHGNVWCFGTYRPGQS